MEANRILKQEAHKLLQNENSKQYRNAVNAKYNTIDSPYKHVSLTPLDSSITPSK